jgi:hypothetical protein
MGASPNASSCAAISAAAATALHKLLRLLHKPWLPHLLHHPLLLSAVLLLLAALPVLSSSAAISGTAAAAAAAAGCLTYCIILCCNEQRCTGQWQSRLALREACCKLQPSLSC